MRAPFALVATVLTSLLTGCTASISGDGTGTQGTQGGSASDDPSPSTAHCSVRPSLGTDQLRLLTKREYEATLRELFGAPALDSVAAQLAQLPDKRVAHGFRSMAKGTTGSEVEAYYAVGSAVSAYLTASVERLSALEPCLGAPSIPDSCASGFISSFGERIYRRPLSEGEGASLLALYGEGAALGVSDAVGATLLAMLQAPAFLYRVETAGVPHAANPAVLNLTGHEIATRLAYLAWGSGPDQELLESARSGALSGSDALARQLERLLADPRAKARQAQFFSEWLEIEDLPNVNQSPEFLAGIPAEGLATAMKDELDRFLGALSFDRPGTFRDLLTSNLAFVGSASLAAIYGVQPGAGPEPEVELDAARRGGLLSRAALLFSTGEATSPIRRGAFVRRKLLCDPIPAPDADALPAGSLQPPEFRADMTSRQRWTAKTSQGVCGGCHASLNPFGFALENYDSLGRYRTTEAIIDPETGLKLNELAIDADVDAPLGNEAPTRVTGGAVGLGVALAESPQARECFAKQWFRFVNGREETSEDACVLGDMVAAIERGATIRESFERMALAPEFRMRRIDAR